MSIEEQLGATIDVVAHDSARLDEVWTTLHGVVVPSLARVESRLTALQRATSTAFGALDGKLDVIEQRQELDHRLLTAIAAHFGITPPEESP